MPSIGIAFCLFIPTEIVNYYSEAKVSQPIRLVTEIARWPFWIATIAFFLCGFTIQLFGKPVRLIPPSMRSGKGLN